MARKTSWNELEGLTDKERRFCHYLVMDDMTQAEAYRMAYQTNTDNRKTVDCNASQIRKKPHVKAYIDKLWEKRAAAERYVGVTDKERRINLIWERIDECVKNGNDAAIARYLDMLAKLNGDYVNITKDISDPEKPLSKLSDEELKALLDTVV